MKNRAALVLAALAGSATAANAQVRAFTDAAHLHPVHVAYTLVYQNDYAALAANAPNYTTVSATNNGVVQPGEGAGLRLFATLKSDTGTNLQLGNLNAGQSGTTIFFDSTIQAGTTGVGQLAGLWSGSFDLVGSGGAATGTWVLSSTAPLPALASRWGLLAPYAVGGGNGTPANGGARVNNVQASQFGADVTAQQSVNPTNTIWRGLWIPDTFAGQTVTWTMTNSSVGLPGAEVSIQDNNGGTVPVALSAAADFASVKTPVATPSPSSLALLGLGGVVAARRRRR